MSEDFHLFGEAVRNRFHHFVEKYPELFVVESGEKIFDWYLAAFPEGTNPIFRTRTEHDCACCKNFIRNLGKVVAIDGDKRLTVWDDLENLPEPYSTVAGVMADVVRSSKIVSIFRTKERSYGAVETLEYSDGETYRWKHFQGTVSGRFHSNDPDRQRGDIHNLVGVFRRGLEELTTGALATALDLAETGAIYRGSEFVGLIRAFSDLHAKYPATGSKNEKDDFIWSMTAENPGIAGFRNTAIGTLVINLSADMDLDEAVRKFEAVVAPTNYKRPSALITQKMVDSASNTLRDLGLESAIARRHARISDVSVENVLFVDNSVRAEMKDGIAGLLADSVAAPKKKASGDAIEISITDFVNDVLPKVPSMEVFVENKHSGNFMSVTAPVDPEAGNLFKWDNGFAWSYDGEAADSIKARVKKAGGKIDARLRVSLAWFNTNDLDIHVKEPNGNIINYANKSGKLDVDMNVSNPVRNAVENVVWNGKLADGKYEVKVHCFSKRENRDPGFVIEYEFEGDLQQFSVGQNLRYGQMVSAITIEVKNDRVVSIKPHTGVVGEMISQDKWGVATQSFVPVETLVTSPNHWDGAVGNKHWFFILKDCLNPEPVRGIYNEFLKSSLEPHRKVFEVLGSKSKAPFSTEQLSGVGFSAGRGDSVKVSAGGRLYNITF